MLESTIEKQCIKLANALGLKNAKLSIPSNGGFPDRLFLPRGGIPFFVEFKRKNGVLSMRQRKHLRELGILGYLVHVCYSVDDFKKVLVDYDANKKTLVSSLLSERRR